MPGSRCQRNLGYAHRYLRTLLEYHPAVLPDMSPAPGIVAVMLCPHCALRSFECNPVRQQEAAIRSMLTPCGQARDAHAWWVVHPLKPPILRVCSGARRRMRCSHSWSSNTNLKSGRTSPNFLGDASASNAERGCSTLLFPF